MKKYLFILLVGSLLTSCSSGKFMTSNVISTNGTKTFNASYDDVWIAVKGVLATNGYGIAFEKKEKGIINTDQKLIRTTAQAGNYTAQATGIYRQYLVKIKPISDNQIKVVLTPKIYSGNVDISEKKIWVIEGNSGEILLWQKFFKDVQSLL